MPTNYFRCSLCNEEFLLFHNRNEEVLCKKCGNSLEKLIKGLNINLLSPELKNESIESALKNNKFELDKFKENLKIERD